MLLQMQVIIILNKKVKIITMCFVRRVSRRENGCNCVDAVKSTYTSLLEIGYRPCEALYCAMKLLKIRHPDIPDWKIPKMTAQMINSNIDL